VVEGFAGLRWIRPPQQERSRQTLDRLLDAAETMVAEKGFADTSVAEVARRADSSVGAFYTRFPNKQALLHALYDRYLEQAMATADDALDPGRWRGVGIPEILREVVRFLVAIFRDQRGLIRAFTIAGHSEPEFLARRDRLSHYVSTRLSELLLARSAEIGHPEPRRACHFGLTMVFATLDDVMLFAETRPSDLVLEDEPLAAELARMFLAYLDVSNPSQEDR
jgi:AcrR family transcriptional regulator